MKSKIIFSVLGCVCVVLSAVAQTAKVEDMVLISAGKFWMGRTHTFFFDSIDGVQRDRMDDIPATNVYLDTFYIDKYEVMNADYARYVAATGARAPWHWPQGRVPEGEERFPAANVNWFEASDYCKWMGKRLPTEAEWEKAARGGLDRNRYSWGDDKIDISERLLFVQAPGAGPRPAAIGRNSATAVGSFPPNGYGLYDMTGNVLEWTNDWYDNNYYPFMEKQNPRGPQTGRYKALRGAGWADAGEPLMTHYRSFSDSELRSPTVGIRCAK